MGRWAADEWQELVVTGIAQSTDFFGTVYYELPSGDVVDAIFWYPDDEMAVVLMAVNGSNLSPELLDRVIALARQYDNTLPDEGKGFTTAVIAMPASPIHPACDGYELEYHFGAKAWDGYSVWKYDELGTEPAREDSAAEAK